MYNSSPSGLPGNDDLGTMGSWYVFSSIGLYPVIPGVGGFSINLPKFKNIKIKLADNVLIIQKQNQKIDFVKSLDINNKSHNSTWLSLKKIKKGGTIIFNRDIENNWIINDSIPKVLN